MAGETTQTLPPPAGPTPASAMTDWMGAMKTELPNPSLGAEAGKETNGTPGPEPKPDDGKSPAGDTGKPVVPNDDKQPEPPAELAEDKWPRTAQEWKKFKEARKQSVEGLETKIKGLEKELTETKSKIVDTPTDSPEWKSLVKERDELSEKLRVTEVTQHPRFVAHFKNKTDAQINLAKSIVGTDAGDKVEKLLALPESEYRTAQLEEFLLELTPLQQSRFGDVLNRMAQIEQERQGEISKAKESYEFLQNQKAQTAKAQLEGHTKTFMDTIAKVQDPKDGMPAYQKREGSDDATIAWNKAVDDRLMTVKDLLVKGEPASIIKAALDAVAFPEVLKDNLALRQRLAQAEEQVKKLSAATPKIEGQRNGNGDAAQPVAIKQGARPNEAIGGWMQGLRLASEGGT